MFTMGDTCDVMFSAINSASWFVSFLSKTHNFHSASPLRSTNRFQLLSAGLGNTCIIISRDNLYFKLCTGIVRKVVVFI